MTSRPAGTPKPPKAFKPVSWLRARFFAGVVVGAPVGITIWLVWSFINFVDDRIKPLIPADWNPETHLKFALPGMGLLVAVAGITLLGVVATNFFGKFLLRSGEVVLARVPLVRSIYSALKQVFETFGAHDATSFKEVVLVEYPRKECWAVGFVTASPLRGELGAHLPDHVSVFVPFPPNPTTGTMIFLPRREVRTLAMSVEDAAKLVMSVGIVGPDPKKSADAPEPASAPKADAS